MDGMSAPLEVDDNGGLLEEARYRTRGKHRCRLRDKRRLREGNQVRERVEREQSAVGGTFGSAAVPTLEVTDGRIIKIAGRGQL